MFEKLAGKLLSRLLSKYFVSPEQRSSSQTSKKPSSSWTQLGVWSGYLSLENLELRKEVVNDLLRSKGLPFELVHCTLGRVEITVPWSKLGKSAASTEASGEAPAVVVVVIDGIHALLRTNYDFDDDALRQSAIAERRQELQDSMSFGKNADNDDQKSGLAEFLRKRLAEGIMNDVLEKIQIHIRDVHVRLEDVESDPTNPFACGVTLESLHVQADDDVASEQPSEGLVVVDGASEDAVCKVAQLNHFAIYWNSLDYGDGLPAAYSVLHDMKKTNPAALSQYLDRCIVRRSNSMSSPTRTTTLQSNPNHSYLLRPVDGTCHVTLSTNPKNLELRPALVAMVHIENVSVEMRDFQCGQIVRLLSSVKEHEFAKQYRLYRPQESVSENPRAWWEYSVRVIQMELRESNMRWSWKRFHERFELRRRYCELYERKMRYPVTRPISRVESRVSLETTQTESVSTIPDTIHISVHGVENLDMETTTPDDGAGPSTVASRSSVAGPSTAAFSRPSIVLDIEEDIELQEIEDGLRGDLSVRDIVLFRAIVSARVADIAAGNGQIRSTKRTSGFRRMMSSFVGEDVKSVEEYARLIAYLESASEEQLLVDKAKESLLAVSFQMRLDKGCFTFFSPLPSTANLHQHKRLQERFLELRITDLDVDYSLLANYNSFCLQTSLGDFVGSEIRSNSKEYVIVSRSLPFVGDEPVSSSFDDVHSHSSSIPSIDTSQLVVIELTGKPIGSPGCDFGFRAQLDAVEIVLLPDCEWLRRIKSLAAAIPSSSSVSKDVVAFWDDLSMARINASDSAVAELRAKADAALFKHKNIDFNVQVNCPIVRIGDGRGCNLILDLGRAALTTERLAGVATGKLSQSVLESLNMESDETGYVVEGGMRGEGAASQAGRGRGFRRWESSDTASLLMTPTLDGSVAEPVSPMRGLNKFFLGSSAISLDSRNPNTIRSVVSVRSNDVTRLSLLEEDGEHQQRHAPKRNLLHSCFYDVFLVRLFSGTVMISGDTDNDQWDILNQLSIRITIEKSVIPSDHTLCRLKTDCIVDNVALSVSETLITKISGIMKAWNQVLDSGSSNDEVLSASNGYEPRMTIRSELKSRGQSVGVKKRDAEDIKSDTSSVLNENEFLDALESEISDEHVDSWSENPWISDVERNEEKKNSQSYRRRRTRSASDVSSISDRSRRVPPRKGRDGSYLNAENLASLEEKGVDSGSESDLASEAESFHSALSLRDRDDLASALQTDIAEAENELVKLKDELLQIKEPNASALPGMAEAEEKSRRRQALRLRRVRLEAELRALRAAQDDLVTQMPNARQLQWDEESTPHKSSSLHTPTSPSNGIMKVSSTIPTSGMQIGGAASAHARALLRAKKQRPLPLEDEDFEHNLTKGLNRELFQTSFAISKVSLAIYGIHQKDESTGTSGDLVSCELCMSQCVVSMLRRANDMKFSASVDNVTFASRGLDAPTEHVLLLGGTKPSIADTLLPYRYPHHVASTSVEDKLLRVAIDVRKHSNGTRASSYDTLKLRVLLGDIEASPDVHVLLSVLSFGKLIINLDKSSNCANSTLPNTQPSQPPIVDRLCSALTSGHSRKTGTVRNSREPRSFCDCSIRLSSVRVKVLEGSRCVGALVCTGTSGRFGRALTHTVNRCRGQLEIKFGNVQLLQISESDSGYARELFGRRDPHNPLAQMRVRFQLVPSSQPGGWVVERGFSKANVGRATSTDRTWNLHCGLKVHSAHVVASPQAFEDTIQPAVKLLNSLKATRSLDVDSSLQYDSMEVQDSISVKTTVLQTISSKPSSTPIRWRVDVKLRKLSAVLPGQGSYGWTLPENVGNNVVVACSLCSSLEESQHRHNALAFRFGITDASITRSSDDWPILDSSELSCDATLACHSLSRNVFPPPQLKIPSGSVWNEQNTVAFQDSFDADDRDNKHWYAPPSDEEFSLCMSVSPIRINLSAPSCCLLIDAIEKLSQRREQRDITEDTIESNQHENRRKRVDPIRTALLRFRLRSFEAKLLREAPAGSTITYADPLASLVVQNVIITSHRDSPHLDASARVGKVSLYDLSSLPGVRVIGREYGSYDTSEPDRPFVSLSLNVVEATDVGVTSELDVRFGRIQCILIPSILGSMLSFQASVNDHIEKTFTSASDEDKEAMAAVVNDPIGSLKFSNEALNLQFSCRIAGFECIISSRDIFSHIKEKSIEPINVVTLRWKAEINGTFIASDNAKTDEHGVLRTVSSTVHSPHNMADGPQFRHFFATSSRKDLEPNSSGSNVHPSCVVSSKVVLAVDDFQALRTCVTRLVRKASDDGDVTVPYCYTVSPPAAGEQRITNQIAFKLTHRLAGTSLELDEPYGAEETIRTVVRCNVAQALQLEVCFVDILFYIRRTTGGMNEAFTVTLKPMLDILQGSDESDRPRKSSTNEALLQSNTSLKDLIRNATSVCCVQAEGFHVTCVPGGATQLTRSPIVKCAFMKFKLGVAMSSVPQDMGKQTSTVLNNLSPASASKDVSVPILSVPLSHLVVGGWLNCEISANYHNRRLAAWEPAVEPWVLDARIGVDLMQLLKVKPLECSDRATWSALGDIEAPTPFTGLIPDVINESAGGKIRDFGRLLRSPFKTGLPSQQFTEHSLQKTFPRHSDLSYMMLASTEPTLIGSALYVPHHSGSTNLLSDQQKLSLLPSNSAMEWLGLFGHPMRSTRDGRKVAPLPSLVVSVSDEKPLNVNLTGALIENVLGYVGQHKEESTRSRPLAPHWIRNDCGMKIRFREVLDGERIRKGEKARKTTLSAGSEIPLILKRRVSQVFDPHRGHIWLEVGGFEDTIGRLYEHEYNVPKGSLSTNFRYKIVEKIPVDTVGVHQYSLTRNKESQGRAVSGNAGTQSSRDMGSIIVRVEVRGGIKVVSVESPLALKNTTDSDLFVEIRDRGVGLPLIWRSLIVKPSISLKGVPIGATKPEGCYVPVPVDIIPSVNDESVVFSVTALARDSDVNHETEIGDAAQRHAVRVTAPPPYSQKSIRRGVIKVSEISMEPMPTYSRTDVSAKQSSSSLVHLNAYAMRIGRVSLDRSASSSVSASLSKSGVPEQRMLLFRPPIVFKNHLPVTINVQVRVNTVLRGRRRPSSRVFEKAGKPQPDFGILSVNKWENVGVLSCGKSLNWTGAVASSEVELRVRVCEKDGQPSREFPSWSTPVVIPSKSTVEMLGKSRLSDSSVALRLGVSDAVGVPLNLLVDVEETVHVSDSELAPMDNVRVLARSLPEARRVVSIYVPFWIIDGTGRELEFYSNSQVAGQLLEEAAERPDHHFSALNGDNNQAQVLGGSAHGLAELLEDENLLHIRSQPSLDVLMIGDEKSNRLCIRRREKRWVGGDSGIQLDTPWSDPIAIQAAENSHQDVAVFPPSAFHTDPSGTRLDLLEPFAFRSRIVSAPEKFGGRHGTKLIHLVNRYAIVNELGRDIEVLSDHRRAIPVSIGVDDQPTPFHFNDSERIRIRPKEFGWGWSGSFSLKKKRREVLLRLRHKLKGHVIIVSVEFYTSQHSPSNVLVLRTASYPPFRLENHTTQALHFSQSSTFIADEYSFDSLLLPYHKADFAWDDPDEWRRSVVVCVADIGYSSDPSHTRHDRNLGSFKLDQISPGAELKLQNHMFAGQVVADGPTRVLRITDSSLPRLPSNEFESSDQTKNLFNNNRGASPQTNQWIDVRFSHGVGISVVDWTPQELLFIRLDDISIERRVDSGKENVSIAVGCVTVDNQLWVTPYPVLMRMGHVVKDKGLVEKRRKRRHNAVALSWYRSMNTNGGDGDLTLLNRIELSTEPLVICIDGAVSDLIWTMAVQAEDIHSNAYKKSSELFSRDSVLRSVLGIVDYRDMLPREKGRNEKAGMRGILEGISSSQSDFFATAALAAKLSKTNEKNTSYGVVRKKLPNSTEKNMDIDSSKSLPKARKKYYIEKLKISTMKTEISWSGALPAALFSFFGVVRPALTFEGLPILLRQYTSSHAYGSVEDHLQDLKYHYISIWRILDVLAGLTFKPTFMVRACIFTTREGIATVLDWLSNLFSHAGEGLLSLCQNEAEQLPYADEKELHEDKRELVQKSPTIDNLVYRTLVAGTAKLTASLLLGTSGTMSMISSSFRYSAAGRYSTSGSLRARNPRLFANVDGKDLLVEYVEGENAGNAILSRVRMGIYLGEGYLYHIEEVGVQARKRRLDWGGGVDQLILMLTSERVLLLNGDRYEDFCSVIWEATFDNVVYFELYESEDEVHDLVKIWYLADDVHTKGSSDEPMTKYASAVVAGLDSGLDLLLCKTILVPLFSGAILREKISMSHLNVLQ